MIGVNVISNVWENAVKNEDADLLLNYVRDSNIQAVRFPGGMGVYKGFTLTDALYKDSCLHYKAYGIDIVYLVIPIDDKNQYQKYFDAYEWFVDNGLRVFVEVGNEEYDRVVKSFGDRWQSALTKWTKFYEKKGRLYAQKVIEVYEFFKSKGHDIQNNIGWCSNIPDGEAKNKQWFKGVKSELQKRGYSFDNIVWHKYMDLDNPEKMKANITRYWKGFDGYKIHMTETALQLGFDASKHPEIHYKPEYTEKLIAYLYWLRDNTTLECMIIHHLTSYNKNPYALTTIDKDSLIINIEL